MKSIWTIDNTVLENIRKVIIDNIDSKLAKERKSKNIEKKGIDLSKNNVWKILVGCEITSRQKSGENSPTDQLLKSGSKLFDFNYCKNNHNFIIEELKKFNLRRYNTIAEWLILIIKEWELGEWDILQKKLTLLKKDHSKEDEKQIIDYLRSGKYKGLGLKQSRNFLQWLGLSIYEIPIDSRVIKVLENCGCNFIPGPKALQDDATYEYLENGLQMISEELQILPCELDACFFHEFGKKE
jgi:hypothetical protein